MQLLPVEESSVLQMYIRVQLLLQRGVENPLSRVDLHVLELFLQHRTTSDRALHYRSSWSLFRISLLGLHPPFVQHFPDQVVIRISRTVLTTPSRGTAFLNPRSCAPRLHTYYQ